MKKKAIDKPHSLTAAELADGLKTALDTGLTAAEAARRLEEFGRNELPKEKSEHWIFSFLKQFHSGLTYILLGAAVISVLVGDVKDAIAIIVVILIDVVFGFIQERRADAAVSKLKEMVVPEAEVVRDGEIFRVPAATIVPGDLIVIREGSRVPADARLVACNDLRTDEASLTGESTPVNKNDRPLPEDTEMADMRDMVWMGTAAVAGMGRAVVVATASQTEFGQVAVSLVNIDPGRAPFERAIDRLGWRLGIFSVIVVGIIAVIATVNGDKLTDMFVFAVAMAISVIPEGLPSVLTVVLAIGVSRMAKRQAIVRHVPAVETLGETDVICTDKTGTLTRNQMTVRDIAMFGLDVRVSGHGYEPKGEFFIAERPVVPGEYPDLALLLKIASLGSSADIVRRDGDYSIIGDPTEGALTVMAAKAGFTSQQLASHWNLISELPFSSERKLRATLVETRDEDKRPSRKLFVVGAYESLAERSTRYLHEGDHPLNRLAVSRFQRANDKMADHARRVIALAIKEMPADAEGITDADLSDLTLVGLVGMIDPPRPEVAESLERCRQAGIRVIMITGDQQKTALAVGREIGMVSEDGGEDRVFTGSQVAEMTDSQFEAAISRADIYARVTPAVKLRLVEALKKRGHIVAMTGDGVNDAPALKKADIGVAMGQSGTDVAREVSDMVLMNDNFATIVNAIEEGRVVYRNVKQTTAYLFTTNIAEAFTVLMALLIGLPLPLLAGQILWMNLVTDGFPDIALATEPAGKGVLDGPPRRHGSAFITKNIMLLALVTAVLMCATTLALFEWDLGVSGDLDRARSVAFTTMCFFQLWNVFNLRSETKSLFQIGFFTNRFVTGSVVVSFLLQLAVLYLPFLNRTFKVVPLGAAELFLIAGLTILVLPIGEGYKWLIRRGLIPARWL